ncbi:protein MOS2-like [Macadamia integrifolia]|uniref:protein MOS2-like n=1 Tax=Macadamia integrifolia TaxID=60698 RepID=UPI001C4EA483|nr:protein MOS2-like [Macadamia integrifolia]
MKLSFSLPSKASSKPSQHKPAENFKEDNSKEDGEVKHEYVTEFDPSKSLNHSKKLVIPPKPNEWRPLKKMKNLDLPVRSSADDLGVGFEVEAPSTAGIPDSDMSYGLNLRQDKETNISQDDKDKMEVDPPARSGPGEDLTLLRFKEDMKNLPDDRGFDEFVDVPVEGFGAALLAGYGWQEGRGIGRNAKEDVKVVEYTRKTGMTGLGFVDDMPDGKNHQCDSNAQNVPQKGPNEKIEHLQAQVDNMPPPREPRAHQELKEDRSQEDRRDHRHERGDRSRGRDRRRKDDERRREGGRRGEELRHSDAYHSNNRSRKEERRTTISWLTSHIRVRIVSKDFRGGKVYLKKGEVVDVVGPTTCDISMDENRELIQGVDQEILETALPRRGGPVLVLYGKHKGVFGSLVEKNIEKETGVIQDADTHSMLNVRLEQIAEYVGDPSYLGY